MMAGRFEQGILEALIDQSFPVGQCLTYFLKLLAGAFVVVLNELEEVDGIMPIRPGRTFARELRIVPTMYARSILHGFYDWSFGSLLVKVMVGGPRSQRGGLFSLQRVYIIGRHLSSTISGHYDRLCDL